MSILAGAAIGAVAGLIVSSWQGFKDPPWEGFFLAKFLRSIFVGMAAGAFLSYARLLRGSAADNPGILAFAIIAVERVIGEAYKGFFRRGPHDEYYRLLRRISVPESVYPAKILLGLGFVIGAYWLFRLLAWWLARMVAHFGNLSMAGLLAGIAGGLLVAIGGALKDSQFEGFKPLKFLRSPLVGALTGMLMIRFSSDWFLVALATVGSERVVVELYKTFLKRQIRGIHAGKPISHPAWLARRGFFAASFGIAVTICSALLLLYRIH
jgi:hypothetical protein